MEKKGNVIQEKSFAFALKIISLYKELTKQNEFVLSKQLLRSGTSIGANVEEALAAQSRKDFLHKMSIASKEARETEYFLKPLMMSKLVPMDYSMHLKEIGSIVNILTKIVKTTTQKI